MIITWLSRNHDYRTVTYAMYFLGNKAEELEQLVETAFVYHDIALWSDHALAYTWNHLRKLHWQTKYQVYGWGLDPNALRGAIHWNHKITAYHGPHCRKADWIDANKGMLRMGMSKENIDAVEAAFPNHGDSSAWRKTTITLGLPWEVDPSCSGHHKVVKPKNTTALL